MLPAERPVNRAPSEGSGRHLSSQPGRRQAKPLSSASLASQTYLMDSRREPSHEADAKPHEGATVCLREPCGLAHLAGAVSWLQRDGDALPLPPSWRLTAIRAPGGICPCAEIWEGLAQDVKP